LSVRPLLGAVAVTLPPKKKNESIEGTFVLNSVAVSTKGDLKKISAETIIGSRSQRKKWKL
jgi:hypothetical protein